MRRSFSGAVVGLAMLAATSLPAFGHAHLVSSVPAPDSTVAPGLDALHLHFSERVEPKFTGLVLEDSAGRVIPTGATASDADPATITVPVSARLSAGRYQVAWHALAVDGHKTSGSFGFIVTP
jgi:methionine-rich copper-binding protein CopC